VKPAFRKRDQEGGYVFLLQGKKETFAKRKDHKGGDKKPQSAKRKKG